WVFPAGRIFVGDVRNLGLLTAFHRSVQLEKADDDITVSELSHRVSQAVELDKELVIDPRFFSELAAKIPGIGAVQILLKRGRADNELTRYRYDVVLEVNPTRMVLTELRMDCDGSTKSIADALDRMQGTQESCLRMCSIPNRRLSRDIALAGLLEHADSS